ncbi:insulinase family protein [bacterium]|nr:insulinase family protein [bacterium]
MKFRTSEADGLRIHVLPTAKFKTTTIVVDILSPLRPETVTLNALIPAVLERGTRKTPTVKGLQERLDDLYGASLDSMMFKIGERQVAQFELEVPNEKFLSHAPALLEQGIKLLAEVLLDPALDGEAFRATAVELEKEALRKRVEGLFNNKGRYAAIRCVASMCADEDYRLFSYGRIEDLAGIDAARLYSHYRQWLKTSSIDVFVVGDVDPDAVTAMLRSALVIPGRQVAELPPTVVKATAGTPREVVDRFDVNQGQLVMGFRTPVTFASSDYPRFTVYNGVLGGYAHSKLFANVREKASLAYSAFSRFDSHKGLLMIQAGINIENFEKATAIIHEQLEAIAKGDVCEDELLQTKAMIANDYREMADSPGQLAHFALVQGVEHTPRNVAELLEAIEKVTVEDLQAMARKVSLDTVYFLRDKETVEATHA